VQEGEGSSVGLFNEGCFKAGGNGGMELGIDDVWRNERWSLCVVDLSCGVGGYWVGAAS